MVEPSKIIFFIENTIPPKEDIISLYIGYHSILKQHTTHVGLHRDLGLPGLGLRV